MSPYLVGDSSCGRGKCAAVGLHFYPAICNLGLLPGRFHTMHQYGSIGKHFVSSVLVYFCFYILIWDSPSSNPLHIVVDQWLPGRIWFQMNHHCRWTSADLLFHCAGLTPSLHGHCLSQGCRTWCGLWWAPDDSLYGVSDYWVLRSCGRTGKALASQGLPAVSVTGL